MKTVDLYFDFSSTNSYFAAFLVPRLCEWLAVRVNWLPLHLGALFRDTGFDVMAMPASKARYLWRDHERWAAVTGLPIRRPSRFPIKTADALRGVIAAARQSGSAVADSPDAITGARTDLTVEAAGRFSQAVMRAYWERDANIADRQVLTHLAEEQGFEATQFVALLTADDVREELRTITAQAAARGVFGAPTIFVGDEMFWGKDRLDFVERCLLGSL